MSFDPDTTNAALNLPTILVGHPSSPKLLELLNHPTLWDENRKWGTANALTIWLMLEGLCTHGGEFVGTIEPSVAAWIDAYDLIPATWRGW